MDASPTTAIASSRRTGSAGYSGTCKNSTRKIERKRYLIQQQATGHYLATLESGQAVWVKDPMLALQHCRHETVLHNLYILREFFDVPGMLAIEEVTFYANASNPLSWFVVYD